MTRHSSPSLRDRFIAFDDALARRGVPRLSKWWRDGLGAWLTRYEQDGVLEVWGCAGRGSAKSTALYKLAAFFAVYGEFSIPAGERHYAIVLSRLKEEASKGPAIIHRWLSLLGIPSKLAGDVVELADLPRGIRVVAASVAAASGWRAFFVGKDERSKWPASGIESEDAAEIDTSASAMTATHANAPVLTFGSAWGAFGDFYDAIIGGSTDARHVLGPAATWIVAPYITEESCRKKERDARRFAREYGSEFDSAESSHLTAAEVHSARRVGGPLALPAVQRRSYLAVMDPATRANDWVLLVVGYSHDGGTMRCEVARALRWQGTTERPLVPSLILSEIAGVLEPFGLRAAHSDQHAQDAMIDLANRAGLRLFTHTMTAGNRPEIAAGQKVPPPNAKVYIADAYEIMKLVFVDRAISIPDEPLFVRDLLSIRRRLTATSVSYDLPTTSDRRHADFAACLALALALVPSALDVRKREADARWVQRLDAALSTYAFSPGVDLSAHHIQRGTPEFKAAQARIAMGEPVDLAVVPPAMRRANANKLAFESYDPADPMAKKTPGAARNRELWAEVGAANYSEYLVKKGSK